MKSEVGCTFYPPKTFPFVSGRTPCFATTLSAFRGQAPITRRYKSGFYVTPREPEIRETPSSRSRPSRSSTRARCLVKRTRATCSSVVSSHGLLIDKVLLFTLESRRDGGRARRGDG